MASRVGNSASLTFAILTLASAAASIPAVADDVPESLRIEQKAKKAYAQRPVVPIDRGNAHHRDAGDSGGVSPDRKPPGSPNAPAQSDPKSANPM